MFPKETNFATLFVSSLAFNITAYGMEFYNRVIVCLRTSFMMYINKVRRVIKLIKTKSFPGTHKLEIY